MGRQSEVWRHKTVCIAGGTAGLGYTMAMEFALRGAKVVILGRNEKRGKEAESKLRAETQAEIQFFSVDFAEVNATRDSIWFREWLVSAKLDVAISAIGRSDRGYLADVTRSEFDEQYLTNVWTSLVFSQACREQLLRQHGTLVHIASLAGIIAAPGMGAYSISKHGVVAMSRQLRVEWQRDGISVLLVAPGPIKRSDSGHRYDALVEAKGLSSDLGKPGGGANLKAIDPQWLSQRVIRAIERHERELVIPSKARLLAALGNFFPSLFDWYLKVK